MASETMQELISAYLDDALEAEERGRVERLIKTDQRWKTEYNAMKKTALILSSMDKIAAPGDMVKRVSTAITLSKGGLLQKFNSRFSFTLTKPPVLQYMALVFALVLIVYTGSMMILRHNMEDDEMVATALQDNEWIEEAVGEVDSDLAKEGYNWMHLKIDDDGTVSVENIGEVKQKPEAKGKSRKKVTKIHAPEDFASAPGKSVRFSPEPLPSTAGSARAQADLDDKRNAGMDEEKNAIEEQRRDSLSFGEKSRKKGAPKLLKEQEKAAAPSAPLYSAKDYKSPVKARETKKREALTAQAGEGITRQARREKSGRGQYSPPAVAVKPKRYMSESDETALSREVTDVASSREKVTPPSLLKMPSFKGKISSLKNHVVTAIVRIDRNGYVTEVSIIKGSGDAGADSLIRKNLRKALFKPAENRSGAVPYSLILKIEIK